MEASPRARVAAPPPSLAAVGARAVARVLELLDTEITRWRSVAPVLAEPLGRLRELVAAGGKRLRPAFAAWGYAGAGGSIDERAVVDAGAALELLHAFALVHDDVMDGSERRRGLPAIHRRFADVHAASSWRGDPRRFGAGAAILVGDFALVYADRLLGAVPAEARTIYNELRVELCVGQFLDLSSTAKGDRDAGQARTIEWYKSGKYTVERPLHLGAALAGRRTDLGPSLSAFGLPLGEAFQMRDDLLGVFGDESVTGKPVGDDLREGKLTPLVAHAVERVGRGPGAALLDRIGSADLRPDEVAALRELFVVCGARDEVEREIDELVAESLDALARVSITAEARAALAELGAYAAWRDR